MPKNQKKKSSDDGNRRIPFNFRFKTCESESEKEKEFSKILKEIKKIIKK